MKNDPLLQPLKIRHLNLKNRVMLSAHEPSYAEDGLPKDKYRLYHVERAKGGTRINRSHLPNRPGPPHPEGMPN